MIVCDATVSIAPLVLASLSLALCSMADSKRLGKIVGKTIGTFVGFYVCGATAAGINITPTQLITAAFLFICIAMGTPAIPVAGTTVIVSYKENELDKDVYNS